jgi:sphinganine-1-phosphate aldolase
VSVRVPFPEKGRDPQELIDELNNSKGGDAKWDLGKVFCLTYPIDESHHEFLKDAYGAYISENFLNPMAFASLKKMEREVVRMSLDILHGDDKSVGTMTSGGTESILMAVKAAREMARKKKPWILRPELVAPKSAHVAFEKACKYFDVKYVPVDLDDDYRVSMKALKKACGRNTIMIIGSAPQYPQGVIDPIEEIGAFAQKKKLLFHVDACVGGFMLPWLEKLGEDIPPFDFRVPGVTSISADLHKYGFAAKGASLVMYRDMKYMKHQFFISTDWTGGVYASPNMPGTRPGGAIAAAWATMQKFGQEGYMEQFRKTLDVKKRFCEGVNAIDGMKVCGDPKTTVISFESTDKSLSAYAVADQMTERGWFFDKMQKPQAIHLTIMPIHANTVEDFLTDLAECVQIVRDNPELAKSGDAAMYGMMAKVPVRGLVKKTVESVMEGMWGPEGEIPDLANAGKGDDASPIMKLTDKYGPMAMDALEKVEDIANDIKEKTNKFIPFKK